MIRSQFRLCPTLKGRLALSKLLYVISSPRGEDSESIRIAEEFLSTYLRERPEVEVERLNLWDGTLPTYGGRGVTAKMAVFAGQTPAGEEGEAWAQVQRVFAKFAEADEYLFAVPMWNHGVPWVLKHLIDTITQPGLVFGFDATAGYTGLLTGKRAVVVYTSAVYWPGAPIEFGTDFHSTYFNDWLRFAGVSDVSEIRFQQNLVGTDVDRTRQVALQRARELGAELAGAAVSDLITREELAVAIESGSVTVVETLGPMYYDQGHLPGAVNIPHTQVAELAPSLLPVKDAAIVVYCSNTACQNSGIARAELRRLGYSNVRKYAEGKQDWEAAGLPLETGVVA
jgi:FMN-dependent NADH-azoreductase